MPKQNMNSAAWTARCATFVSFFGTFCVSFEPVMAFALAVAAYGVISNSVK